MVLVVSKLVGAGPASECPSVSPNRICAISGYKGAMQLVRYRHWNWEFDYGEEELPVTESTPESYTDAHFDNWGRLVRAECHDKADHWYYEYFCDDAGWVLEKRSYDEK